MIGGALRSDHDIDAQALQQLWTSAIETSEPLLAPVAHVLLKSCIGLTWFDRQW